MIQIDSERICNELWKVLLCGLEKETQFKFSESYFAKDIKQFGGRMYVKVDTITGDSFKFNGLISDDKHIKLKNISADRKRGAVNYLVSDLLTKASYTESQFWNGQISAMQYGVKIRELNKEFTDSFSALIMGNAVIEILKQIEMENK